MKNIMSGSNFGLGRTLADHTDHADDHGHDEHDFGLAHDLERFRVRSTQLAFADKDIHQLVGRRDVFRLAAVAGLGAFAFATLKPSSASAATTQTNSTCADIPEETAGPFPGDGTNGPNVLTASGVVRRDITTSFGSSTGIAAGVPFTITLTITDSTNCAPAVGYAVYLWHADSVGRYSMYSSGVTDQNYLRGVQVTDANGKVSFKTIFPGCYDGRWPHMHYEVYPSLADAGDASKKIATSQIALPKSTCDLVYVTKGYEASPGNLSKVSLATDNVFSDDAGARQVAVITGSVGGNLSGSVTAPVSKTAKASAGVPGGPNGQGGPGGQPPQGPGGRPPQGPGGPPAPGVTTTVAKSKAKSSSKTTAKKTTTKAKTKKTTTTRKK